MTDEKTTEELEAEDEAFKKARGDDPEIASDADAEDELEADGDGAASAGDESEDGATDVDSDGGSEEDEELAAESAEDEDDGGDSDKGITIPKAVFDARNEKSKQKLADAERRLEEAESKLKTQTASKDVEALQTEIDKLEDEYEDKLMEGELKDARSIRKDLRAKQKTLTDTLLTNQSVATGSATVEQIRFETQLAQAEVKYPTLNPDGKEFDQEIANEVSELMGAFQASGFQAAAALTKALAYVMRDAGDPEPVLDKKVLKDKRAAAARKKVAKVAKKSPPDLKDAGRDSDKGSSDDGLPDITKMSPEQFANLSKAELSKLRGDHLSEDA